MNGGASRCWSAGLPSLSDGLRKDDAWIIKKFAYTNLHIKWRSGSKRGTERREGQGAQGEERGVRRSGRTQSGKERLNIK